VQAPDVAAWKVAVNDGVVTKHMHSNVHSAVLCVPSPWRSGALQVDDAEHVPALVSHVSWVSAAAHSLQSKSTLLAKALLGQLPERFRKQKQPPRPRTCLHGRMGAGAQALSDVSVTCSAVCTVRLPVRAWPRSQPAPQQYRLS
jgi:hypothetical protein